MAQAHLHDLSGVDRPVLVCDLDGTLIRTDLLDESFWAALASRWTAPFAAFAGLLSLSAPDTPPFNLTGDLSREGRAWRFAPFSAEDAVEGEVVRRRGIYLLPNLLTTGAMFAAAPYHAIEDPVERVLGYVELRKELLAGEEAEYTCLVGTMVQEAYSSNPAIRDACKTSIFGHAETLEDDIEAAIQSRGLRPDWTAKSLALHTQAVLQGAFILAKASGDRTVAEEMVDHLARYIRSLFACQTSRTAQ